MLSYGCENLTKINIPKNIKVINSRTFDSCRNLTETTIESILSNIEIIEREAFSECDSLRNIVIPDNIKTIGSEAFWGCDNLTSVKIGSSVESIESLAFSATNLKSIYIPSTVDNVEAYNGDRIFDGKRFHTIANPDTIIYFGHDSKPEGWSDLYNESETCKYGYTYEEYEAEISNL